MAGFLIMVVGKAAIVVALPCVACLVLYAVTIGNYRPERSAWPGLTALVIGFATFFPANIGSHSLWLSAFGETLDCKVVSIESSRYRRSSHPVYMNKLRCGDRQLEYYPSMYRSAQDPGTEMDIVVDRTGLVPDLEPDKVGLGPNLLFLLTLLVNGVFIFLVAWLPLREPVPAPADKPKLQRDFL